MNFYSILEASMKERSAYGFTDPSLDKGVGLGFDSDEVQGQRKIKRSLFLIRPGGLAGYLAAMTGSSPTLFLIL
jgi:hypothetical protein